MAKPVAVDLFSGAGGLSEGFRQAGFLVAASVESDPHAAETQRRNHARGRHPRTEVLPERIQDTPSTRIAEICARAGAARPHVVMGGPPCQGFSRSNRQTRNMDNPDNHLFRDFLRVVKGLDPEAVVLENVADVTFFEGGAVASEIRSSLEDLDYEVCPGVLDASLYGVPQRRRRLFFVAVRRGALYSVPQPETTRPVSLWDAIGDLPELPNGHTADEMPYRAYDHLTTYQTARRNGKPTVRNNVVSRNMDYVVERYQYIPQGGNWENIPEHLMRNYADRSRCHQWIYRRLPADEPSITIMNYRKNMLIHPYQDRGLSVREAARIQSFDDDYVFHGTLMSQQQQVANAVPPLLARAVARSLRHALGL